MMIARVMGRWPMAVTVIVLAVSVVGCKPAAGPGAAASPLGTPEATSDHTGPLPTVVLTDWAPGTPIAMQPGKEIRVPTMTPWPTSTPRPTPTRRPGPTATAFLLHKPASDASGTILFNSSDPEISRQSIMAIPVDGRGQKAAEPALMSLSIDFFPVLDFPSPDGHYLLMHRPVEPEGQPFVIDWESRQVWPLLKSHPIQEHLIGRLYGWHPDSRQVLFWFFNNEELWLVNLETGDHTVLAFTNGPVQGAAISPDGGKVVYVDRDAEGNAVMYVVKTDGSDRRSLIGPGEWLYVFGWSADGRHILYYAGGRSGTQGDLALSTADWDSRDSLWIMDVDNNERRPLFSPYIFGWGFEPVWSPDGRQVASTGLDTDHNFGCAQKPKGTVLDLTTCRLEGTAIYVEDISTGEVRRLAPGIDPTWSPDGSMIAFLSGQSGTPQIWVIQADGAESHQITIDLQQKSRIVWTRARR